MINTEQLSLLITNTIAITHQVFTINCGEFATVMADETDNLDVESFDLQQHLSTFDYQPILDSGYKDMVSLTKVFNKIAQSINYHELEKLVRQLPSDLACLTTHLTSEQLKPWITHALDAKASAPIYCLHQIFSRDSDSPLSDEPISETIRQAIAFNELDDLEEVKSLTSTHIHLEDLNIAASIHSFKVFDWMVKHASLSNKDIIFLLSQQVDKPVIINYIFPVLRPLIQDFEAFCLQAKDQKSERLHSLLRSLR